VGWEGGNWKKRELTLSRGTRFGCRKSTGEETVKKRQHLDDRAAEKIMGDDRATHQKRKKRLLREQAAGGQWSPQSSAQTWYQGPAIQSGRDHGRHPRHKAETEKGTLEKPTGLEDGLEGVDKAIHAEGGLTDGPDNVKKKTVGSKNTQEARSY